MRDTLKRLLQESFLFRLGLYVATFGYAPFAFLSFAVAAIQK